MAGGALLKDITVIVDIAGARPAAVLAVDLARRLDAHLVGLAVAFDPLIPVYTVAAPIPADFITAARDQSVSDARAALAAFDRIGRSAGISVEPRLAESVTGDAFVSILRNCVLTDLVVVGQEDAEQPETLRGPLIEALLFQSGVRLLLVPHTGVTELVPDKALIGWNGSAAAGRAVRAAMPLLAASKEVVVALVDEGRPPPGEPGADVGAHLARHGLNVTVRSVANMPNGAGEALLALAAEEGCDWMLMGAYGHSRLREFLLGGATRHVLHNARLPVFMVH